MEFAMRASVHVFLVLLFTAQLATAEVVGIDVVRRDDAGTHERIIARVHFAVDPKHPANRGIADIDQAPTNASGRVEFDSDLLLFVPKSTTRSRNTVFLEVPNRGRDQSLALLSGARQSSLSLDSWVLGDRFLLNQGFTVAFLGWQFDVRPSQGLTFRAPVAPVEGVVRESYIEPGNAIPLTEFPLTYCASPPQQRDAVLTFRARIDERPQALPRTAWEFVANGCAIRYSSGFSIGLYEAVYTASGSPIAGLGLAAIRDVASLLHDEAQRVLSGYRATPETRVLGYGYSQSGRFLREFVRDGFNADERGRRAFDGLMISSAGAGGGSFNHRFAVPGQAGNSVLSILRPVDLPPFTDDGLLATANRAGVTPKIIYTFSSTEYWARAGSLTHTNGSGADAPLAPTSRLYFLTGTPHSSGVLPPATVTGNRRFQYFTNFAQQRWVGRALLIDLDEWVHKGVEPPASRYPSVARGELVRLANVHFPAVPTFPFPAYMPNVWKMDLGGEYAASKIITNEPPILGATYSVLVPQVNGDGNDRGGVALPEIAVPLGTHTGWNIEFPELKQLGYLAGLVGAFHPFAATRADREKSGDARPSIAERYRDRQDYVARVERAARTLVRERLMLADDVPAVLQRAVQMWNAVVPAQTTTTQ